MLHHDLRQLKSQKKKKIVKTKASSAQGWTERTQAN